MIVLDLYNTSYCWHLGGGGGGTGATEQTFIRGVSVLWSNPLPFLQNVHVYHF